MQAYMRRFQHSHFESSTFDVIPLEWEVSSWLQIVHRPYAAVLCAQFVYSGAICDYLDTFYVVGGHQSVFDSCFWIGLGTSCIFLTHPWKIKGDWGWEISCQVSVCGPHGSPTDNSHNPSGQLVRLICIAIMDKMITWAKVYHWTNKDLGMRNLPVWKISWRINYMVLSLCYNFCHQFMYHKGIRNVATTIHSITSLQLFYDVFSKR